MILTVYFKQHPDKIRNTLLFFFVKSLLVDLYVYSSILYGKFNPDIKVLSFCEINVS